MFCKLHTSEREMFGVLVYNDEDAVFAQPQTAHALIISQNHSSVLSGAVCPPMAFIELLSDHTFVVHQGILIRNERCKFECLEEDREMEFDVDFSSFEDINARLLDMTLCSQDFYTLSWTQFPRFTVKKQGRSRMAHGLPCVRHWIASLAVSRAFLTNVFVTLCSAFTEQGETLFLNGMGKRPRTPDVKTWVMWYPAPKPKRLKTWLEFLSSSKSYAVSDILDVSPAKEGFYRFSTTEPDGDKISVLFDDATPESDASTQQAYLICNPGTEAVAFLQLTLPLHICTPSEKKASGIWGEGFFGRNENVNCFVLPMSPVVSSGTIGPLRSKMPGRAQEDEWLKGLPSDTIKIHEILQFQASGEESKLMHINKNSFPVWCSPTANASSLKRQAREKPKEPAKRKKKAVKQTRKDSSDESNSSSEESNSSSEESNSSSEESNSSSDDANVVESFQ